MNEAENIDIDEPIEAPEETEQPEAPEAVEKPEEPEKPEPPKVEFTPEQQEVFNEVINKKVAKQREAEREAQEARERLKALEEELRARQQPQRPTVPPKPDNPYDDDYEVQMSRWAESLAAQQAYDRQMEAEERRIAEQQQRAYMEQQQAAQRKNAEYFNRGDKLGISQLELSQASQQINTFNLHHDVVDHLLDDAKGPEIALYLSKNLEDLQAVANMTPTKAAVYLETVVKPKARREPPKVVTPPAETDTGSSITQDDDGISYE